MMDSTKKVFVCKKCGANAMATNSCICSTCDTPMTPIPYDTAQWLKLPIEQRNGVIRYWMQSSEWVNIEGVKKVLSPNANPNPTPAAAAPASQPNTAYRQTAYANGSSSSVWVGILRVVVYIILIGGILASLIAGFIMLRTAGFLIGVLVIIGGCIGSVIAVAGIMVFLDMAADLRKIRSMLERSGR